MIKELRLAYPVVLLCRVLDVTKSGYYAWIKCPLSSRQQEEERLELEIQAAHKRTRQTYGPERLQRDLSDNGVVVGVYRIKRIRRKLGLRCRQKRRFKFTTDSRHSLPVAENLLAQKFVASAPNQIWLTDITYIPTGEGWLYLAGHKDLFTGEVVGYAMGERMTKNLVSQSLLRAVTVKRPAAGLIHHSDRGSQYCALEYSSLLDRFGMRASMSRKGNCYDNAPWKASGACSKTNRFTIAGMQRDRRLYRTSQNTSKFSIIGREGRPDSVSCLPLLMNDVSMKNDWQHETFGVHY